MDRRDFLKIFSAGAVAAMGGQLAWHPLDSVVRPRTVVLEDIDTDVGELAASIRHMTTPPPDSAAMLREFQRRRQFVARSKPADLRSYLDKMANFESPHYDDVYLEAEKYPLVVSVFKRLDRVQNLVGHGNFNVLGFDAMLKYARRYRSIGEFTGQETDFLEALFADNVERYGFYGEKVIDNLTAVIPERECVKVPYTGHFLFRGESLRLYQKVKREVGESITLTSGIRSIVKQTHLFLAKTIQARGNLSRASRSLAPPGHSFHGIGDFDVGKVGFGTRNFTSEFARTAEFKRLVDLGYVQMRYPEANLLGVRYEPWHVKVV